MKNKIIWGIVIGIVVVIGLIVYSLSYSNGNLCWPYCPNMTDQDRGDIKNSALEAQKNLDLVQNNSKPSITILSPNGGEIFKKGSQILVKWVYNNLPGVNSHNPELIENVNIIVIGQDGKDCLVTSIPPVIANSYPINVSNKQGCYPLNIGKYKVQLDIPQYDNGNDVVDQSDNYFTITN